ncbi:hypothetical protein C0Q70_19332 [Pomacea canaliculata]|uniref:Uncharacterized protein n=1 Tax=Pomacea canaliculata TaxID=400727 RepID=A0A2T7NJ31_POMCA|nr:hypothetical protein C0Q70_19332 [Pomacea canaliculata]
MRAVLARVRRCQKAHACSLGSGGWGLRRGRCNISEGSHLGGWVQETSCILTLHPKSAPRVSRIPAGRVLLNTDAW